MDRAPVDTGNAVAARAISASERSTGRRPEARCVSRVVAVAAARPVAVAAAGECASGSVRGRPRRFTAATGSACRRPGSAAVAGSGTGIAAAAAGRGPAPRATTGAAARGSASVRIVARTASDAFVTDPSAGAASLHVIAGSAAPAIVADPRAAFRAVVAGPGSGGWTWFLTSGLAGTSGVAGLRRLRRTGVSPALTGSRIVPWCSTPRRTIWAVVPRVTPGSRHGQDGSGRAPFFTGTSSRPVIAVLFPRLIRPARLLCALRPLTPVLLRLAHFRR